MTSCPPPLGEGGKNFVRALRNGATFPTSTLGPDYELNAIDHPNSEWVRNSNPHCMCYLIESKKELENNAKKTKRKISINNFNI